jgi:hypothetical protein
MLPLWLSADPAFICVTLGATQTRFDFSAGLFCIIMFLTITSFIESGREHFNQKANPYHANTETCVQAVWFLPTARNLTTAYRPGGSVTRTSGTTDNPNNFHSVPTRWNNISKPTGLGRIEKTPLARSTSPCMAGAVE